MKKQVNRFSSKEMLKGRFLLDSDVFLSYIGGGELVEHAEKIIKLIADEMIEAFISSMLYDDIISALRSKGMDINSVIQILVTIASIPHKPLPITPETSISALALYAKHGGSGKLHYFDAVVSNFRIEELNRVFFLLFFDALR